MSTIKKLLIGSALVLSASTYAGSAKLEHHTPPTQSGRFFSIGAGAGWSYAPSQPFTTSRNYPFMPNFTANGEANLNNSSGAVLHMALGYKWHIFSLRVGYSYLPDFKTHSSGAFSGLTTSGQFTSTDVSSLNTLSLTGNFFIHIYHNAHFLLGGGYVHVWKNSNKRQEHVSGNVGGGSINRTVTLPNISVNFSRPIIRTGLVQSISKQISAEIIYTRIFGKNRLGSPDAATKFLPDINTFSFVVNYFFSP